MAGYLRLPPSCNGLIYKLSSDSTLEGKVTIFNLLRCLKNVKKSEEKSQPHEISDRINHVYSILLNSGSKVLEKKTEMIKHIFLSSIATSYSGNILICNDKMKFIQRCDPTPHHVFCATKSYSCAETKNTIQNKSSIDKFRNELKKRIYAVEAEKQKTIDTRNPNLHSVQCGDLLRFD